jgi:hypothetical protein
MGSRRVASLIQRYEAKNEKSPTESPTASPNKKDDTKITNASPRSVISKIPSCVSTDSSDAECSSLSDQLSADLSLSREGNSLSKLDGSSNEYLTLVNDNLCFFFMTTI